MLSMIRGVSRNGTERYFVGGSVIALLRPILDMFFFSTTSTCQPVLNVLIELKWEGAIEQYDHLPRT